MYHFWPPYHSIWRQMSWRGWLTCLLFFFKLIGIYFWSEVKSQGQNSVRAFYSCKCGIMKACQRNQVAIRSDGLASLTNPFSLLHFRCARFDILSCVLFGRQLEQVYRSIRLYVKSQDPVQKSFKLKLSSFVSSPCLFELRQLSM